MAICTLPEGGSISVQFAETGRTFRQGDAVDLDAAAAPGVTWREALGHHVSAFVEQGNPRDVWADDHDSTEEQ